jgi:uncharacterized protein GlcG (DUF336 family)
MLSVILIPIYKANFGRTAVKTLNVLSLESAYRMVLAAVSKAEELGIEINVAVMDQAANLKAFARMDRAWLGSIDIALKKAKTSSLFNRSTEELGKLSQPGGPIYGVEHSNGGLITFAGGMVVRDLADNVVGAVGVSGSTIDNDRMVAEAAVKVWGDGLC